MGRPGVFSVSIVCLLFALVVASEPGTERSGGASDGGIPEASLRDAEAASRGRRNNASWSSNVTAGDVAIGRDSRERAEGEDYEGEDEYEDELKAVAESHEAMSRDDTRNSNASTAASAGLAGEASHVAKNFDSREVITVNSSDEDVASNEAITDEIVDKYDQEVAELLKYKKERNSSQSEGSRTKTKRVPTVKKELSTQKEILIGSNETQVPKNLVPPEDPANRLNEETDAIRRRNVESNRSIESEGPEYSERSRGEGEIVGHNRYSESEANGPKKLDKRQETILQDLKSYLLTEYATEEEQRQKLRELKAREDALVENLLKLLVKLAENPSRWERVQRLLDPERVPDYDIPETYHRLRYSQLSPASRELLRRREEEYQGDFNVQSDGFAGSEEYEPRSRDFALSKSWPDLSYGYNPAWRAEERSLLPVPSGKWSWRQPASNDASYWSQRGSFLPVEKSYWPALDNDGQEDAVQEAEAEKMWQQQRVQHTWNRDRPDWPVEKPAKVAPTWTQQGERPAKLYDRDQANGVWEKSKNRSESNRSSAKQEKKEKVVLPQITMKTWNSLTSDPATWPHKLPGAKPWPKDENGKSYNPNADLVKKLGLDKQSGAGWSKEDAEEKSNGEVKPKDEKQSRLFSSKDEEKLSPNEATRHKSYDERSNLSDYKTRSGGSVKSWTMLSDSKGSKDDWTKTENMQGDDPGAWRRKYEGKNSWSEEAQALPKIQSVGAWVMAADQSTWKPYQLKPPIESATDEDNSRRWSSKPLERSNAKWTGKGSWPERANDSWMDHESSMTLWPEEKANIPELWSEKSSKPGSWFAKTKAGNADSWKVKGEWLSKPESAPWMSKMGDKSSWATRSGSWSTKSNESWTSKTNLDNVSKFNDDPWPAREAKEEDPADSWTKKSNEQNNWTAKGNELSPWQQKINDEWSYGKTSSTGTWPAKWKQFAYHRVTAMPISKPGTTADAASSKSKNAFVAVSAVSSPKYTGNEWRKNEDEPRSENGRADEQERTGNNQVQVGLERPIYAWKKDTSLRNGPAKGNNSDPLENQLEALRQIDFWSYKENEAEKRLASTSTTVETTSKSPMNTSTTTTTTTVHRRGSLITGNDNGLIETDRRTISMK